MSTNAYTEDQLVEQPASGLFAELGWQTVSAMEEKFGPEGTLGRETSGEAADRFHAAGLKAGAKDNGAPGLRTDYAPNYYAAFLLDGEGNNVEAVCMR